MGDRKNLSSKDQAMLSLLARPLELAMAALWRSLLAILFLLPHFWEHWRAASA